MPSQFLNPKTAIGAGFLYALSLSLAMYLGINGGGELAGCSAADPGGCTGILGSKWALWAGLPVSWGGVAVYATAALAVLWTVLSGSAAAWGAVLCVSTLAAGAAVWFTGLQFFVLDGFCPYCLGAHAFGFAAALLIYADGLRKGEAIPSRVWVGAIAVAGIGMTTLITGQVQDRYVLRIALVDTWENDRAGILVAEIGDSFSPSERAESVQGFSPPTPGRTIQLADGKLEMVVGEYPIIGNPNAEKFVAVMSDYTCPGCRRMHGHLEEALQRYEGQFAVVVLPMALDGKCNPNVSKTTHGHRNACLFSKMGLAMWNADPAAFWAFDHWLYEGARPPERSEAVAYADELIGAEMLDAAMANPLLDKMLYFSINLFYSPLIEKRALPTLLTPKGIQEGNPESKEALFSLLEEHLELVPARAVD